MHSSDLLFWIINILDASKSGDVNTNTHSIKNPRQKIDKSKLKTYSMVNGDTFARQKGIIPIRWDKLTGSINLTKEKDNRFDLMERKFHSYRKN